MTEPEFSRPATLDDLKLLLRSLRDQGADYLLVGGYALAAHGYQRATTDIDLLVPASAPAGQHVKDALLVLPDKATKDIDLAWFQRAKTSEWQTPLWLTFFSTQISQRQRLRI